MALLKAPLSSSGSALLDSGGEPVRLAGVNWAGAHQNWLVPSGLDKLSRTEIATRIVDMGLNHVRLPFALGTFVSNNGTVKTGPVPEPSRVAANPDLASASPWQVYQECVAALTGAGLAVIPNQHLLFQGWCCSEADCNGLWYNDNWPASTFTGCWQMIAEAFAGNPLVIGYDLHNEPRPATIGGTLRTPSWGDGNAETDFQRLYADTIPLLRAAGGQKLYFCEGLSYAADLTKAGAQPVGTGSGTVYSLHDYSWYHPAGQSQAAYNAQMDAAGGYIQVNGQAPLYIGEFGTDLGTYSNMTSGWLTQFLSWAQARQVHWCWWELSAISALGIEPVTNEVKARDGDRASYGLMQGQDWDGTQTTMLRLLEPLM